MRANLPDGDIQERDVTDYHALLGTLQALTKQSFDDFSIPNERLERHVTGYEHPTYRNRFQEHTDYTDVRYCDRELFLRQLDGAILFLNTILRGREKGRIGF